MKKLFFILAIIGISLSSCGPMWILGSNKTFGKKKQRKQYSKRRGHASIYYFNKNKTANYC